MNKIDDALARIESAEVDNALDRLEKGQDLGRQSWAEGEAIRKKGRAGELAGQDPALGGKRFDLLLKGSRELDNRSGKTLAAIELLDPLPAPDHAAHCLMGGDFDAWDILPAVLELTARPADCVWIATLGFHLVMVKKLAELVKVGRVKKAGLLCSHYFQASEKVNYRAGRKALEAAGVPIAYARTHAKIICLDMGAAKYVVEGSANLRSCHNVEQFTLTHSAGLHDFHAAWIAETIRISPC